MKRLSMLVGCSKCKKMFPRIDVRTGVLKGNFSGFERDQWPVRTHDYHKNQARRARDAATNNERLAIERESGARWTKLFELSYFNAVTDHAIDPMHLLYLGIAKKLMKHYYTSGLLTKEDVTNIQVRVNKIRVPASVGRIPRKISSGFCSFTADQWKNWILIYSSVALRGILPHNHFKIWMIFVKAVYLITRKHLKKADLLLADSLLLKLATQIEQTYGQAFCPPNLHMACHLKECIEDFSSVYSFWCFSFER